MIDTWLMKKKTKPKNTWGKEKKTSRKLWQLTSSSVTQRRRGLARLWQVRIYTCAEARHAIYRRRRFVSSLMQSWRTALRKRWSWCFAEKMFAERCSLNEFGIEDLSISMEYLTRTFSSVVKDLLRRRSPNGTPLSPHACSYVVALRSLSSSVMKNNNENGDQSDPQSIKTKRKGNVSLDLAETNREVKLTVLS